VGRMATTVTHCVGGHSNMLGGWRHGDTLGGAAVHIGGAATMTHWDTRRERVAQWRIVTSVHIDMVGHILTD
jgi:hypothetical protein